MFNGDTLVILRYLVAVVQMLNRVDAMFFGSTVLPKSFEVLETLLDLTVSKCEKIIRYITKLRALTSKPKMRDCG